MKLLLALSLLFSVLSFASPAVCPVTVMESASNARQGDDPWEVVGLNLADFARWAAAVKMDRLRNRRSVLVAVNELLAKWQPNLVTVPLRRRGEWMPGVVFARVGAIELRACSAGCPLKELSDLWDSVPAGDEAWNFQPVLNWIAQSSQRYSSGELATAINVGLKERSPHDRLTIEPLRRTGTVDKPLAEAPRFTMGALLVFTEQYPKIWRLIEGSPAAESGLRTGDALVSIRGQRTIGLSALDTIALISGKPGDRTVVLEYEREGVRRKVQIELAQLSPELDVDWKVAEQGGSKIGILTIRTFLCPSVERDVARALDAMRSVGVQGIVLDLRDNLGGQVDVLTTISGYFLGKQRYLSLVRHPDEPDRDLQLRRSRSAPRLEVPTVILMNGHSASASEALAGILRHHKRALLVGTQSHGKGSTQGVGLTGEAEPFREKGAALYLTSGVYYFESGETPQYFGLTPDVLVHQPGFETWDWTAFGERNRPNAFRVTDAAPPLPSHPLLDKLRSFGAEAARHSTASDRQMDVGKALLVEWLNSGSY